MADARDVASKAADNAARLTALFHIFEHGPEGQIGAARMQAAAHIVTWHLYEAQRLSKFDRITESPESDAVKLDAWLLKYCHEHGVASVSPQQILQYGPASLRNITSRDNAIDELIDAGRVRQVKRDGRWHVEINPALLEGDTDGPA
jgi:putative DNA primase/helicase